MRILITSDHAGFELRKKLYEHLKKGGLDIADSGPYENDPEDDYPDFIAPVALEVSQDPNSTRAIIIGGSGQGEAIVANRFPSVRAIVFNGQYKTQKHDTPDEISLSRLHNDSNVISLGARFLDFDEAKEAVEKWLATPFSGEAKHMRRIEKIERWSPCNPLKPEGDFAQRDETDVREDGIVHEM